MTMKRSYPVEAIVGVHTELDGLHHLLVDYLMRQPSAMVEQRVTFGIDMSVDQHAWQCWRTLYHATNLIELGNAAEEAAATIEGPEYTSNIPFTWAISCEFDAFVVAAYVMIEKSSVQNVRQILDDRLRREHEALVPSMSNASSLSCRLAMLRHRAAHAPEDARTPSGDKVFGLTSQPLMPLVKDGRLILKAPLLDTDDADVRAELAQWKQRQDRPDRMPTPSELFPGPRSSTRPGLVIIKDVDLLDCFEGLLRQVCAYMSGINVLYAKQIAGDSTENYTFGSSAIVRMAPEKRLVLANKRSNRITGVFPCLAEPKGSND
jgi:hypothetical protein